MLTQTPIMLCFPTYYAQHLCYITTDSPTLGRGLRWTLRVLLKTEGVEHKFKDVFFNTCLKDVDLCNWNSLCSHLGSASNHRYNCAMQTMTSWTTMKPYYASIMLHRQISLLCPKHMPQNVCVPNPMNSYSPRKDSNWPCDMIAQYT